jgi:acyl-CoA synthetase (NDP forming)
VRLSYLLKKLRKERRNFLIETEARELLSKYRIPFSKWALAKNEEEAVKLSKKIGFPVTLKIVSKDIVHKSEVGGVMLNLMNEADVKKGYNLIMKNVKRRKPKAKIEGILVSKMIEGGKEVIVGGIRDPQFGHLVVFGAGGIYTELVKDVSFRAVPLTRKDAEEMIKETKIYEILRGCRGKKYDVNAITKILIKTSKFLEENEKIKELDINPLLVLEKGAVAVDARIVVDLK